MPQRFCVFSIWEQVSDPLNSSLGEEKTAASVGCGNSTVEAEAGPCLGTGDGSLRLSVLGGERAAGLTALQSTIAAGCIVQGKPLITQGAPRMRGWLRPRVAGGSPGRPLVSVPVRMGARAVGVLEVVNRRRASRSAIGMCSSLRVCPNQFGLAIDNLRRRPVGERGRERNVWILTLFGRYVLDHVRGELRGKIFHVRADEQIAFPAPGAGLSTQSPVHGIDQAHAQSHAGDIVAFFPRIPRH